jgi:hypothetical protein
VTSRYVVADVVWRMAARAEQRRLEGWVGREAEEGEEVSSSRIKRRERSRVEKMLEEA